MPHVTFFSSWRLAMREAGFLLRQWYGIVEVVRLGVRVVMVSLLEVPMLDRQKFGNLRVDMWTVLTGKP